MAFQFLSDQLEQSATGRVMRQLTLARIRFSSHPLYRRWSMQAYEGRLARWAEIIPDLTAQYLPVIFMVAPLSLGIIALLFGTQMFQAVATILLLLFMVGVLVVSSAAPMIAAGVAAFALSKEREAGRWELLLLMPYDRAAVLMMRISTMLFPYRPLITTLDILQTIAALLLAVGLNAGSMSDDNASQIMGACFLFILPSLFMLTWERRQDYAASVALGAFAGVHPKESHALGWALGGSSSMVLLRAFIALIALAFSPLRNGLGTFLPAFVAGPAILPMLGVPLSLTVVLWVAYYGLRELFLVTIWKITVRRVEGWD